MRYRTNRKTGDRISEIGIGSSYMYEAGMEEAVKALRRACEGGINFFDLAAGHGDSFPIYGEALHDVREQIFYQIHFGADYTKGDYGWSLNLDTVKKSVSWMLKELRTDYIDYGFIHCQDEIKDWETYRNNGIYDYILELKAKGIVRHIGLSSHTPRVIQRILDDAGTGRPDPEQRERAHGCQERRMPELRLPVPKQCSQDGRSEGPAQWPHDAGWSDAWQSGAAQRPDERPAAGAPAVSLSLSKKH